LSSPIFSLIIVNFNSGPYLTQCLISIRNQNKSNYEVIIIDNASSDGSLNNIIEDIPLTIEQNDKNIGYAAAQNQGIKISQGEFIMPLNFDIILTPDFLEETLNSFNAYDKVGSVSGKLLRMVPINEPTNEIDNTGILLPKNRFPIHRGTGEIDLGQYEKKDYIFGAMGAAAVYRREMLDDIVIDGNYFDENFFTWYEDIDLEWRARLRGWDCMYIPQAVAYHVGDPHGHGRSIFGVETSIRNRWMMIVSNECKHCLIKNFKHLLIEELYLLIHVIRKGLVKTYLRAIKIFIKYLPKTIEKRHRVRGETTRRCLPEYPQSISYSQTLRK
jgi:GT2 family glycosyltransferase